MARTQRDADTGSNAQLEAFGMKGLLDGLQNASCHHLDAALVGSGQQDRELVASQTRNGVPLGERPFNTTSDLLQQDVPDAMAQRVVDLLEPVEIHDHERKRCVLTLRPPQLLLETLA